MLSARNVILGSLALLLIAIVIGSLRLTGPPDSNGLAADSYGTHRDGHRAAFDLLREFGVPVERSISPPDASLPVTLTLVLWGPHEDLVENEPAYLERLLPWIEKGGRLVVAPAPKLESTPLFRERPIPRMSDFREVRSIWSILELNGLEITQGTALMGETYQGGRSPILSRNNPRPWDDILQKTLGAEERPMSLVRTESTGNWKDLQGRVRQLRVPSSGCGQIDLPKTLVPGGTLDCTHANGWTGTLAASFPRGLGEIVVIAEPLVLGNGQLAEGDNAVLTFDLLRAGDRSVVFDEFYHGLSVRGNPLWLLTRRGAGLMVAVILCALGVGIWRQSIILGPPLESAAISRRAIFEYIDAMAHFLTRSRGIAPVLLTESRDGVLRLLGEQLNLPPGQHDRDSIDAALTRRSPEKSRGYREAFDQLDQAIRQGNSVSSASTIRAIERLFRCL